MNDKEWLDKIFFGEIIQCYMLADLSKIESNYNPDKECGNCNFPLALQIFACMDFIGWLISDPRNRKDDTKGNINSYTDLFSSPRKEQIRQPEGFVNIFRHGLAHEYFAKGCGISRKRKDLLWLDLDNNSVNLDADILLEEFRSSIDVLREKINANLANHIRKGYEEIQDDNSLVKKGLIVISSDKSTTTKSTSINLPIYSSGASIAPPSTTLPPDSKRKI
ncbi:MAG: hypothetical protein AAB600_05430 [Patescibacteria group bacterium]